MAVDYATDFYRWATETAQDSCRAAGRSRSRTFAEEIESFDKSEQQLSNRLTILLTHMLKWEDFPRI